MKAFVISVSGIKLSAVMQEFRAAGGTFPTPLDTGQRNADPISLTFMYDGGASGPAVKCAVGTSATLTITFATGQSITGTYISTDMEVQLADGQDDQLVVTLVPTGTVTLDVTA